MELNKIDLEKFNDDELLDIYRAVKELKYQIGNIVDIRVFGKMKKEVVNLDLLNLLA